MSRFTLFKSSGGFFLGFIAVALLTSCQTTQTREAPAPILNFAENGKTCTESFDFSDPITRTEEEKQRKRELRNQRIYLMADMGAGEVACTQSPGQSALPYASFELPTGLKGRVINAGSKLATAVVFASDIATYDAQGQRVRRFQSREFRRLGNLHGVQFSPRENEKYVVIQANPNLIGDMDSTIETSTYGQNVGYAYAGGYSSGTNTVGVQRAFNRTYAYNGEVAVVTVFPKQEKKKK